MKKHYPLLLSLAIVVLALTFSSRSYADDLQALQKHRAHIEAQLGLKDKYPHASSYYDDLEDHYEMWQIMSDQISQGIR